MKFGLTLGAMLLASNVAFAQVAIDMATLERRYEDVQAAYDRNPTSADRQEKKQRAFLGGPSLRARNARERRPQHERGARDADHSTRAESPHLRA